MVFIGDEGISWMDGQMAKGKKRKKIANSTAAILAEKKKQHSKGPLGRETRDKTPFSM